MKLRYSKQRTTDKNASPVNVIFLLFSFSDQFQIILPWKSFVTTNEMKIFVGLVVCKEEVPILELRDGNTAMFEKIVVSCNEKVPMKHNISSNPLTVERTKTRGSIR